MRTLLLGLLLIAVAAVAMLVVASFADETGEGAGSSLVTPLESRLDHTTVTVADDADQADGDERRTVEPAPLRRPLRIRVLDAEGAPLPGARVSASQTLSPWPERDLETVEVGFAAGDGEVRLELPVGLQQWVVSVVHAEHVLKEVPVAAGAEQVTVRLEPGFAVDGVVIDARGRPVADAEVALEPAGWELRRGRSTRTDRLGRFAFGNVAAGIAGVVRLTARHPLSAPASLNNVPVAAATGLQLALPEAPGESLVGRIVTVDGAPIDGAAVELFPTVDWNARLGVPYRTRSDEAGRFAIPGIGRGNALLSIRHPGYSGVQRIVPVGRTAGERVFELVEGVRVLGELSGDEVAGVTLELTTDMGERGRTVVGADGSFVFEERFSIGTADLAVVGGMRAFENSLSRQISVLIEDRESTELDLACVAPTVVRGRVTDTAGAPLAGVVVSAPRYRLQPRNPERWAVATDAEGRFTLSGLPVGEVMLSFDHHELVVPPRTVGLVEAGQSIDVGDVVLVGPGAIAGRVVRGGRPLSGASVVASTEESGARSAVTDAEGHYRLRGLPSGAYRVFARFATLPISAVSGAVQVVQGQTTEDVDFEFQAGRPLTGQVLAEGGEPLREAEVFVASEAATTPAVTDADGRFEMILPRGDAVLEVFAPGDRQIHVTRMVGAAESDVEIRLPYIARTTLRGRILAASRGAPLVGALIRVTPLDADGLSAEVRRQRLVAGQWIDTRGGRFEWSGLPVGRSEIVVDAPGFAPVRREVTAEPGSDVDVGVLRVEPGARFRGRVVDSEGKPIAGAFVHVGEGGDLLYDGVRRTTTGPDGRFELQGLSADATRVVVASPEHTARTIDVDFPADLLRDEPREIRLVPISSVMVQLTRGGQPVDDTVLVAILYEDELKALRLSEPNGTVRFGVNVAGTYEVVQFGEWDHGVSIEVRDGEADRYSVELELR